MDDTAGISRRLAGMVYESLLLVGVITLMLVPLVLLGTLTGAAPSPRSLRVYVFLGLAAYFIWHWHGGRQTLAMRTWKLDVVDANNGRQPRLTRLAARYALAWPSIGLLGIGIVWALLDRDRQFLHDRLAGTRLVFKRQLTPLHPPDHRRGGQ